MKEFHEETEKLLYLTNEWQLVFVYRFEKRLFDFRHCWIYLVTKLVLLNGPRIPFLDYWHVKFNFNVSQKSRNLIQKLGQYIPFITLHLIMLIVFSPFSLIHSLIPKIELFGFSRIGFSWIIEEIWGMCTPRKWDSRMVIKRMKRKKSSSNFAKNKNKSTNFEIHFHSCLKKTNL